MGLYRFFFAEPCHGEFDRARYEGKSPNEMMKKREHERAMSQGELQAKYEQQNPQLSCSSRARDGVDTDAEWNKSVDTFFLSLILFIIIMCGLSIWAILNLE